MSKIDMMVFKNDVDPVSFYDDLLQLKSGFFQSLKLEEWVINNFEGWKILFQKLKLTLISKLTFSPQALSAPQKDILNMMSSVQFFFLRELFLTSLHLQNISFLQTFNCYELRTLRIDKNSIIELKSLRKCKFNLLKQVHLSGNQVKEFPCNGQLAEILLEEIELDSKESKVIQIQNLNFQYKLKYHKKTCNFLRVLDQGRVPLSKKQRKMKGRSVTSV